MSANAQLHHKSFLRLGARLDAQAPGAQVKRLDERLRSFAERSGRAFAVMRVRRQDRLATAANRLSTAMRTNRLSHTAKLTRDREVVVALWGRADRAALGSLDGRWNRLEQAAGLLAAFSYHGVLARGFALVRDAAGGPVRSAAAVASGSPLDIEFADGRLAAVATGGAVTARPAPLRPRRRRGFIDPGQGNLFGV